MTYNIHYGFDFWYKYKLNEMIHEIKKNRPDILCLQEVSSPETYEYIKQSLDIDMVFLKIITVL